MRFRKLRIAWTVACCIASLLIFVWAVRSFSWFDGTYGPASNPIEIQSFLGWVGVDWEPVPSRLLTHKSPYWTFRHCHDDNWEHALGPSILLRRWAFGYRPGHFESPILLFSIITATLALLPYVPWRYGIRLPPWRFSLRTLLIATTLVAVVLGLVVWLNHY